MKRLFVVLALSATVVGCGTSSTNLVEDYCSYGAVSEAQLEGCIDHVSAGDVERRETNAAHYATGELDECLGDAGPFCEER